MNIEKIEVLAAGKAKTHFGLLLDLSQESPVKIVKHGRPVSVVMSFKRFVHYQAIEDELLALKAQDAEKNGYLTTQESKDFLKTVG